MVAAALAWIGARRSYLTLLMVAAIGAWLYVEFETIKRDRDALLGWGRELCAAAGASIDPAVISIETTTGRQVDVKKPRGRICADAVADLASFRHQTDAKTAELLASSQADRRRKSDSDVTAARNNAIAMAAAEQQMEEADEGITADDRVGAGWFARFNDLAGLRHRSR